MTIEPITIMVTSLENPAKALLNGMTPKMPIARAEHTAVIASGILPVANNIIVITKMMIAMVELAIVFIPPCV